MEDLNEHNAAEVDDNRICWDFSRNLILYIYMFFPILLKRPKEAEDVLKNPSSVASRKGAHWLGTAGHLKENIHA